MPRIGVGFSYRGFKPKELAGMKKVLFIVLMVFLSIKGASGADNPVIVLGVFTDAHYSATKPDKAGRLSASGERKGEAAGGARGVGTGSAGPPGASWGPRGHTAGVANTATPHLLPLHPVLCKLDSGGLGAPRRSPGPPPGQPCLGSPHGLSG